MKIVFQLYSYFLDGLDYHLGYLEFFDFLFSFLSFLLSALYRRSIYTAAAAVGIFFFPLLFLILR